MNVVDGFPPDDLIIDVRPAAMAEKSPVPGAVNIPLPQLRARLGELDRRRPITTVCAMGKTSYFAARILMQNGFGHVSSYAGGAKVFHAGKAAAMPGDAPATTIVAPPGSCHTAAGCDTIKPCT